MKNKNNRLSHYKIKHGTSEMRLYSGFDYLDEGDICKIIRKKLGNLKIDIGFINTDERFIGRVTYGHLCDDLKLYPTKIEFNYSYSNNWGKFSVLHEIGHVVHSPFNDKCLKGMVTKYGVSDDRTQVQMEKFAMMYALKSAYDEGDMQTSYCVVLSIFDCLGLVDYDEPNENHVDHITKRHSTAARRVMKTKMFKDVCGWLNREYFHKTIIKA